MAESIIKRVAEIPSLTFGQITSIDQVNADTTPNIDKYKLSLGLIDTVAYIRFDMSWVTLEIRITNPSFDSVQWRSKYGQSPWIEWRQL